MSPTTPPCIHGVVSVVVARRSREVAVPLEYFPFLYGWKPIEDHWEWPTAMSSGSTANAINCLQHSVECQARWPMVFKSIF